MASQAYSRSEGATTQKYGNGGSDIELADAYPSPKFWGGSHATGHRAPGQLTWKNAIDEADARLARTKIETAEIALFHRIQTFGPGSNALEERAMFDALSTIRSLKARAVAEVHFTPTKTAPR
jgi:hypothetical protein